MKRLQNNIVRRLSVALVLLMTIGIASSFAQDTRQKKKVATTTTTTQKQASTSKTTQKTTPKKGNPSGKKGSTKAPAPTIGTAADRNKAIEYMNVSVGNVSFRMVMVDGGTFTMGATSEQGTASSVEKPAHSVTLSSYYIGETEVTQELWQEVMGSNPSKFKNNRFPVEMVSWEDCQDFVRRLSQRTGKNFRMPTEAEWEYAARGGRKSYGYMYSGGSSVDDVAWYTSNSGSTTHPVAQKRANELGLFDMSGNVCEWCSDFGSVFSPYPSSSPQTNPTGPSSGSSHVMRGGNWFTFSDCCRVSFRGCGSPAYRENNVGLRLAL